MHAFAYILREPMGSYNHDIIYVSSLKNNNSNYKKYGRSFNLLIKNLEDDLVNHNKINLNFINNAAKKIKTEIILEFDEQKLDILVKEQVKEIMEKLMKEVNENIFEEKNHTEIKLSEKEIETNKNFLILNLIFANDKLNKYPTNIVFEKYKKYFVVSRLYRLLYLLAPINLIYLPFGILFGLFGGSLKIYANACICIYFNEAFHCFAINCIAMKIFSIKSRKLIPKYM